MSNLKNTLPGIPRKWNRSHIDRSGRVSGRPCIPPFQGGSVLRVGLGKLSLVNLLQVVKQTNTPLLIIHVADGGSGGEKTALVGSFCRQKVLLTLLTHAIYYLDTVVVVVVVVRTIFFLGFSLKGPRQKKKNSPKNGTFRVLWNVRKYIYIWNMEKIHFIQLWDRPKKVFLFKTQFCSLRACDTSIARVICIIIKNENTLQLWDRRFRRNSSLQAVCDTPIARITSCVSSWRI